MPIQSKLQTRKSIFEVFELVAQTDKPRGGEAADVFAQQKQGAQLSPPNTGGWAWAYSQPLTTHITHNTQHTHSSHVLAREVPSCVRTAAAAASRQSLSSLAPAHAPRLHAPCCGTRSSRRGARLLGTASRSQGDLRAISRPGDRSSRSWLGRSSSAQLAQLAELAQDGERAGEALGGAEAGDANEAGDGKEQAGHL